MATTAFRSVLETFHTLYNGILNSQDDLKIEQREENKAHWHLELYYAREAVQK